MESTIKIPLLTTDESIATSIEDRLNDFDSISVSLNIIIYPKKKYNLILTCFRELTPIEYLAIGKYIGSVDKKNIKSQTAYDLLQI